LLHFLNDKRKKLYICVCYTFILIFKFIHIYFLHVLFVLKIKGSFEKKNPASPKVLK